ncbi:MAG: HNH endonuclease signature motif containing protein [Dehalococcoidia bacterium]
MNERLCECGCGAFLEGRQRRYRHGHNANPANLPHREKPERYYDNGYVYVWAPEHPEAAAHKHHRRKGYILEHRLNWELAHGRRLKPSEHVHHKNEIRDDNRPENLEAMTAAEHRALHKDGRALSLEHRQRLSETTRKAWSDGRMTRPLRQPTPAKPKKGSAEARAQTADALRLYWASAAGIAQKSRLSEAVKASWAKRKTQHP